MRYHYMITHEQLSELIYTIADYDQSEFNDRRIREEHANRFMLDVRAFLNDRSARRMLKDLMRKLKN